jgi:hypothetical protein
LAEQVGEFGSAFGGNAARRRFSLATWPTRSSSTSCRPVSARSIRTLRRSAIRGGGPVDGDDSDNEN